MDPFEVPAIPPEDILKQEVIMNRERKCFRRHGRKLLIAAMICCAGLLQADDQRLSFGMNIGASLSNHWSPAEDSAEYERSTSGESGVAIGFFMNWSLGKLFAVQSELSFVDKGATHNIDIPSFPYGAIEVTYAMQYLVIPISLKFYPLTIGTVRLYTGAGGYYAFLINGTYSFRNEFIPNFDEKLSDIKSGDGGFFFSSGFQFKLSSFRVHLEYRYSMGLVDITFPTGPGFPEIALRNMAHLLLVGVSF